MKKLSRIAAFAIVFLLTLRAADFWQAKPYTEWSDKEAIRLLQNSPWSHQVGVSLGERSRSEDNGSSGGRRNRGGGGMGDSTPGAMDNPNMSGPNTGRGGRGGSSMESVSGGGSSTLLTVCWHSARPIREATVVSQLGHEKVQSEEATKYLNKPMPGYVIAVLGLPGRMANMPASRYEEIAKTATALKIKDKDPIPAIKVEVLPRDQFVDLYFIFPSKSPITLEDKEVEFDTNLGRVEVKRKFKLKEMTVSDKLEL